MAEPKQKDVLDIAIDFFFGAFAADVVLLFVFIRSARSVFTDWNYLWILLLAATLIAGPLAALFRNEFWSGLQGNSIIPPMEETISREAKVILWMLFTLGCASLGLLFIW